VTHLLTKEFGFTVNKARVGPNVLPTDSVCRQGISWRWPQKQIYGNVTNTKYEIMYKFCCTKPSKNSIVSDLRFISTSQTAGNINSTTLDGYTDTHRTCLVPRQRDLLLHSSTERKTDLSHT